MRHIDLQTNGIRLHALEVGDGDRTAILVHGFPDDPRSLIPIAERLAAVGWRCVMPWTRGYPPSDPAPDGDYTVGALAKDIVGLIDALGEEKVLLVGHDWGAVATYPALNLAPDRFYAAATMNVPPYRTLLGSLPRVPEQVLYSWYIFFFQLRFVSTFVARANNAALVERFWRMWSPGWEPPRARVDEIRDMLSQPRVMSQALAYYRHLLFTGWLKPAKYRESVRLGFAPICVPTLLITGELERCVSPRLYDDPSPDFAPGTHYEVSIIPNAGHFLPNQAPDAVADEILRFVAEQGVAP